MYFSFSQIGHDEIMKELNNLKNPHFKSVNFGFESIRYIGPKIWESLPQDLKNKETIDSFKTAIKKWKPDSCPCRLCKTYLQNKGYL